jgi:hypothetical protein
MTEQTPTGPNPGPNPGPDPADRDDSVRDRNDPTRPSRPERSIGWMERRRDKIVAEIERNRRGEYKVPTWVLVAALAAIVVAWLLVIILG